MEKRLKTEGSVKRRETSVIIRAGDDENMSRTAPRGTGRRGELVNETHPSGRVDRNL